MEFVEPIKDKEKLDAMKKILKAESSRNYLLFVMGINSAFRISDLLNLTFGQVMDENGKAREYIWRVKEKKTDKKKKIVFPASVKKVLGEYLKNHKGIEPSTPLFFSRKKKNGIIMPITRQMAYMTIKRVGAMVGLEHIGTHTMRKTWGYHAYKSGVSIEIIQSYLNHSSPAVTKRYIGITQEDIDNVVLSLDL